MASAYGFGLPAQFGPVLPGLGFQNKQLNGSVAAHIACSFDISLWVFLQATWAQTIKLNAETIVPPTIQGPGPGPDDPVGGGGSGAGATPHSAGVIIAADKASAIATALIVIGAPKNRKRRRITAF